jgi:alpha-beta hydrolase superfamily lysophospholipase
LAINNESMSAEERIAASCSPSVGDALYFDSADHRLFGWLHRPPRSSAKVGVVICGPFGYEGICSHRALRAFAESVCALGVPTLRFDYAGTGDSSDLDPEADQLDVWTRDVVAAVSELQQRTGIESVCLLGVRLGALLATLAARHCATVKFLVLIAPVISGRRYQKELRTTRLASLRKEHGATVVERSAAAGPMEVSGFTLSAATMASLENIDLTGSPPPPVGEVLVIGDASLPASQGWAEQLSGQGVRTAYIDSPEVVELIMTAPQFSNVPQGMITATREWLLQSALQQTAPVDQAGECGPEPAPPVGVMALRDGVPSLHAPLIERPVFFTSKAVLFGIVTEPREGEMRRRAVILLNAGADHHIGANGMYVDLARHWAGRGYIVLRMDLSGLGDSGTAPGQPENEVFPPSALEDIRAAMDFIRDRYGSGDITLFGLCSGAYHALRAAAAGVPVNRILMVNPQNYYWKQGTTLTDLQLSEVVHNPSVYRRQIFSLAAWKRLFTGRVNLWRILKIYFHRPFMAIESSLRDLARSAHIRLPHDLGWELEEIAARGVRIVFVFGRGEPGHDLLRIEAGSAVRRMGERCRVHIIDGGDHIFSQNAARAAMKQILSEELSMRASRGEGTMGKDVLHPL